MMPEAQWSVSSFLWFLDQCRVYFSIQLGRCVLFSFVALFVVLILRRSVLKKRIFLKGMAWSLFLAVPFVGKLELFYNNALMCRLFLWWNNGCIRYPAISYGYMLGIAVSGVMIFWQQKKLKGQIRHMTPKEIDGEKIYVSEMPVTPFTVGVFHPKVVVPKVMEDTFETEELKTVLLHERTHIRLGHLWVYLLWDILRALLWMNPLLTCCMRYLKEDMEDICDRVVIQKKDGSAYEYGQMLLKSVKLLKAQDAGMPVTLVGEKDYQDLKHRIIKISEYKPYRIPETVLSCTVCILLLFGIFSLIKQGSYPRYMANRTMCLLTESGELFMLYDNNTLQDAVSEESVPLESVPLESGRLCIDREVFQKVLEEYGIDGSIENFWLGFGGYMKMPGIGTTINSVYVDYGGQETKLTIPYENREDDFWEHLFKNLP